MRAPTYVWGVGKDLNTGLWDKGLSLSVHSGDFATNPGELIWSPTMEGGCKAIEEISSFL